MNLSPTQKTAMKIARKWKNVPDDVSDDDAVKRGFIPPELITLLMNMLTQMLSKCLNKNDGFKRIKNHVNSNRPFEKMRDTARLNGLAKEWLDNYGVPRRSGDVVELVNAFEAVGLEVQEEEFNEVQAEQDFMTI